MNNRFLTYTSPFIKDAIRLISGQIVIAILSIGNVILTARALDVDGRGHLALALLFASILFTFTEFGLGSAGTRLIATAQWNGSEILASHAFTVAVRCIILSLVGFLTVFFESEKIFPGVPVDYLYLGILQVPPLLVAGSILPLLLGIGLAKTYNRILIFSSVVGVVSLIICWVISGLDVRSALTLNLLVGILISGIIWVHTSKALGGVSRPNFQYLAKAYKFGFGLYASNILSFANTRLVWLLINSIIGVKGVGLYSIAQSCTERIYLVADALGTILYPRISEDPINNSLRITPIVFRITIMITTALSILLAILAEWIVVLLFSASFNEAIPIIRLLLVAVIFSSGWRVLSQDINGRGHSGITAVINGIITFIGIGVTAVLLLTTGLKGAAWSASATALLSLFAGIILYGHFHHGGLKSAASLFFLTSREKKLFMSLFFSYGKDKFKK
jgi:O-antigen/teichoic acid export membrane protein